MSSTLVSLLLFPVLLLISIPFAITACITFCVSGVVVFVRLSLIFIELAGDLIHATVTKNFLFPKLDSSSHFSLTSEPTTPQASSAHRRRSIDYGMTSYPPNTSSHRSPSSRSQSDLTGRPPNRRHSSQSSDGIFDLDYNGRYQQREDSRRNAPFAPSAALLSLISGDEGRDFEGLGGWRSGPSRAHGPANHPSRSSSSSSPKNNRGSSEADDDEDDADERAWLSINHRLELPSQPLNHRNSGSDLSEHVLPWRHRPMTPGRSQSPTLRHHHRSATTTMLSSLARHDRQFNSFGISLSTTPDFNGTSPRMRPFSPRSQSENHIPGAMSTIDRLLVLPGERDGGGYFAFPNGSGIDSSTTSPGSMSPGDERRFTGSGGRYVAHYPAGVRYRRRSMSGPGPFNPLSPLR